jgi:hypothetical protein
MIGPADLGWMAAVIDLRGRILTKKNQQRATPQLCLYVDSKQFSVIRKLGELTGTKPEQQAARTASEFIRRGCSEHCPEPHVHVNEDRPWQMPAIARWTLTGASAAVVISNLLPYFTVNREGWEAAMQEMMAQAAFTGQGSGMIRTSIKRLADLGWDIPFNIMETLFPPDVKASA